MKNILGIAIVTAMLAAPVAVHAQGLVNGAQQGAEEGNEAAGPIGGIVGGAVGAATGTLGAILGADQSPRFEEYARGRHHRSYTYRHELRVGAMLPGTGIGYYDVPSEYGVQPGYRYTVLNGHTVLVNRNNRVVQIID